MSRTFRVIKLQNCNYKWQANVNGPEVFFFKFSFTFLSFFLPQFLPVVWSKTKWCLCCWWLSLKVSLPCRTPLYLRATSRLWPHCVTWLTESWWSISAGPNISQVECSLIIIFNTEQHIVVHAAHYQSRGRDGCCVWLWGERMSTGMTECCLLFILWVCVCACVYTMPLQGSACS